MDKDSDIKACAAPEAPQASISAAIDQVDGDLDSLEEALDHLEGSLGGVLNEESSVDPQDSHYVHDTASSDFRRLAWRRDRLVNLTARVHSLRARLEV